MPCCGWDFWAICTSGGQRRTHSGTAPLSWQLLRGSFGRAPARLARGARRRRVVLLVLVPILVLLFVFFLRLLAAAGRRGLGCSGFLPGLGLLGGLGRLGDEPVSY